ncbi:MAG: hypothetical protein ACLUZQ_05930 [Butyricicoccus sp.]
MYSCTRRCWFLAAPHFGYELTAWMVNGNAITSGIEQKPEEKQLCKLTGPITADQTVVVTQPRSC